MSEVKSKMPKFMQTLEQGIYDRLKEIAVGKGTTVQELIRAVIIPEWLEEKRKGKQ